jgi:CubicO group peptidase (beta-lactamase class C family)
VSDIERFLPEYIDSHQIPGVAVALIQDESVAWTRGFGVANAITKRPLTDESLFEVASNSKVVAAYIALRMVDQGMLDLDEPLNGYLNNPWLPSSALRDSITLRHVLSHSSGLGHSTTSKAILFNPGTRYSYSALGFRYAQAVMEHVSEKPLEQLARALVYTPLEMRSSSYVNRTDLRDRTSNGHLRALLPALLFVLTYAVCLLFVILAALLIGRIRSRVWRMSRDTLFGSMAIAVIVALVPAIALPGSIGLWEFSWLLAFSGLVFSAAFAALYVIGRFVCRRVFPHSRTVQRILAFAWALVLAVGLLNASSKLPNVPVPRWPPVQAEAASSMRATVGDMAHFLIELAEPQHLRPETAAEIRTPQIALGRRLSWGLGPGIMHSTAGDALWQWGQHLDFQSLMIIYPTHGFGVVVCTNSDLFQPDVALEIAHRVLGGEMEPIRRAIHLQYNYRDDS